MSIKVKYQCIKFVLKIVLKFVVSITWKCSRKYEQGCFFGSGDKYAILSLLFASLSVGSGRLAKL